MRTSILKITPNGSHKTIGVNLQSNWLFGNHFLIAGFEGWQRELLTDRQRELFIETIDTAAHSVVKSISKVIGEKPIPDSKYRSLGIYAQDDFEIIENKFKLTFGGRIDQVNIQNEKTYNPLYEITNGIKNNSPANKKLIWDSKNAEDISWSTNISFLYSIINNIDLTFTAARSFRSPSLEERYQFIDLGSFVRVGNPYLKPEKGYFFDCGLKIWKDEITVSGDIFLNLLNDLVSEEPGTFEGRTAFIKTNIGKAKLYGFDFVFQYSLYKNYTLSGSLSYVNGEDTGNKTYLPQIPPLNGRISFSLTPLNYFQIVLGADFFSDQNKVSEGEIKTRGYITYDLSLVSIPLNLNFFNLQIITGIDNITNKAYRNHLTSLRGNIINEPGRNFFIKVKADF